MGYKSAEAQGKAQEVAGEAKGKAHEVRFYPPNHFRVVMVWGCCG
jgi:hypothetical protein